MVHDVKAGEFISARTQPKLLLTKLRLEGGMLCVEAEGYGTLRVPASGPGRNVPLIPSK